jgi:biotin transport system ATP-binding protein
MPSIIEIENLTHRFADGTLGLDGVSLRIEAGSFVVIAGANGSGKTTLLRHLNGLLLPTAGSVRVAGHAVRGNLVRVRSLVGMMFQDADSQIVGETVAEDVAFGPENLRLPRPEVERRVAAAMAATELAHLAERRSHHLSGGEKRRLAIAGILAMQPEVIVFDEPFSSLDYPGVQQVLGQIVALHRSGQTILLTTHDLDKVIAHADRLVVLRAGRVARDGPPAEVLGELERCGVRNPRAAGLGMEALSWLS